MSPFDPTVHHRRSNRAGGFDYASNAWFFVTICAWRHEEIFGYIEDGVAGLSPVGQIVWDEWWRTPLVRGNVSSDAFVVMPNHVHGIVAIDFPLRDEEAGVGRMQFAPTKFASPSHTLGSIVRGFKAASTRRVNEWRGTPGEPLWQRSFYDYIIRNDRDLERIRDYIVGNPFNWHRDENLPSRWGELRSTVVT